MSSATGEAAPARAPHGFTLLELVVVLLVASLILAMSAPSLRRFMAGREIHAAGDELLTLTRLARSLAVSEARVYHLHIDVEAGLIWLGHAELPEQEAVPFTTARPIELPDGLQLQWQSDEETLTRGYLRFHPNGRCDPGVLELADMNDRTVLIAARLPHERYAIHTGELADFEQMVLP